MHSDVPVFLGFAAVGGKVTLDFPAQARAWTRKLAGDTGAEVEVQITLAGQNKTRRQEKGFHAMVTPWARERGWDIDDLKQFLLKRIFGTHEFADPATGEVYTLLAEPRTSQLSRRQYCDLIERAMEIAAEDDFYLVAPDEYRKAKEAAAKQAEREARKRAKAAAATQEAACRDCGEILPMADLVEREREWSDGGQSGVDVVKVCRSCASKDMRRAG